MNKHITRLILRFAMAICVFSLPFCKKDLGNYNYKQLPGFYVDTTGQQTTYDVDYGAGTIRIDPVLVYEGKSEVSYLWTIYKTVSSTAADITPGIPDTLSTSLTLETPITKPVGQYILELRVTEISTGIKVFQQYTVNVLPPYAAGFLVSHELNGSFDVDFLRTPALNASYNDTLIRNIYFTSNGNRIAGSPVGYARIAARGGYPHSTYVMSSEEGRLVETGTFAKIFDYENLFYTDAIRPGPGSKPRAVFGTSVAIGDTFYHQTLRTTPKLSNLIASQPDNKGYSIASIMNVGSGPFFYDEKNNRFLSYTSTVGINSYAKANPAARFSLDSLGLKELLFLKTGFNNGSGTVLYGFFKDEIQADKRYLYLMDFNNIASPDKAALDISTSPSILQAVGYELVTNGPQVFYASPTEVYRILLNISGNTWQTSEAGFRAPAGEAITKLKLFNNSLLFIATWNEGQQQGKLYLVPVGNGALLGTPLKTWDGFGGKITWLETKAS